MILGYLSTKHLNLFHSNNAQESTNSLLNFLSLCFLSKHSPESFSGCCICHRLWPIVTRFWHPPGGRGGKLGWIITGLSVSVFPNTLILGIPILSAIDGDAAVTILVQIVVLQYLIWYNILLFLFEINAAREIPSSGASIDIEFTTSNVAF
ncbi:hypothetical protein Bca52824_093081 [Brassica carinata]|uniref:Auxin efflux carrier component n=1 Tax=Brassica carinata TaxID=52824 RepID=A0A8X7P6Q7_BRACI|nr:hypothetical protein Bca52824_093081 [Brassica carinata]